MTAENVALERVACRNIVEEINKFGINDRQRLFLIYLLSLELENPEACNDLSIVSRDFCRTAGIQIGSDGDNNEG